MITSFDCIQHFQPFGYYVLARPMEYEQDDDSWVMNKGVLLAKESGTFDYSFWVRIIDKGYCCKEDAIEVGDIVRLPLVYTRERFWNDKKEMYIIVKESACLAKQIKEKTNEDN